jgi:hypothetical protein
MIAPRTVPRRRRLARNRLPRWRRLSRAGVGCGGRSSLLLRVDVFDEARLPSGRAGARKPRRAASAPASDETSASSDSGAPRSAPSIRRAMQAGDCEARASGAPPAIQSHHAFVEARSVTQRRRFGATGRSVHPVGLGCMGLSWAYHAEPVPEAEGIAPHPPRDRARRRPSRHVRRVRSLQERGARRPRHRGPAGPRRARDEVRPHSRSGRVRQVEVQVRPQRQAGSTSAPRATRRSSG